MAQYWPFFFWVWLNIGEACSIDCVGCFFTYKGDGLLIAQKNRQKIVASTENAFSRQIPATLSLRGNGGVV